jgi:hypothetical protein
LSISIATYQQISHCAKDWDAVLPVKHHLNSNHLQAFENAQVDDVQTNYLLVFLKDKPIGVVYLQQFNFKQQHINFTHHKAIVSTLVEKLLPKKLPMLICGHLFRINFQGFYFKHEAYREFVFEAVNLFIKQQKNYAPSGIIIKDCEEVFVEHGCNTHGYHFFGGDVTMEITRKAYWLVFEDYLNDLQKKYRQRAKKILASFADIETIDFTAQDIEANAATIDTLYWNVVHKQTIKLGTINAQYFYHLKQSMQQNFAFNALFLKGKMVGFYTYIYYETSMETHYIGLDYEANKTTNIYFNILLAGVQQMIAGKYKSLELGRTAKEAKANTGALPKQVFNYIKVKNIVLEWLINYLVKRFNKKENKKLQIRNPFK